jgi:hypothetical protein
MTDDDHIFDAAYQARKRKANADARYAELELTRSRRRVSWATAAATRAASGQTVPRSAAEERYRRTMPLHYPRWMPHRKRAHDLQDFPKTRSL